MIIGGANRAEQMVQVSTEDTKLEGTISLPVNARGVILFVQGRKGSRFSPTIQHVAEILFQKGIASLRFEVLTTQEEECFLEIEQLGLDLLSKRIVGAVDWVLQQPQIRHLPIGYFGEDIGASAVIAAATQRPCISRAIVAHGELVEMTEDLFSKLQTPLRIVVDENDLAAISKNRILCTEVSIAHDFKTIPDSTQSLQKCEALGALAALAVDWYQIYLDSQAPNLPDSVFRESENSAVQE